jgi:hypothetical protein
VSWTYRTSTPDLRSQPRAGDGERAGDGNRTRVLSLGSRQKDTRYQVKAAKFQVGGIRTRLLLFAVLPFLLWRVARNRTDPVRGTPWHGPS